MGEHAWNIHWSEAAASKYYLNVDRFSTIYQTVVAVNSHQLNSTEILIVCVACFL